MNNDRKCRDCGEILKGRSDKKFCSDHCRNNFNNLRNSDSNTCIRRINRILRKNRRILEKLNRTGNNTVHRDKLLSLGFNFRYVTKVQSPNKGRFSYFCYEYGYYSVKKNTYSLLLGKKILAEEEDLSP